MSEVENHMAVDIEQHYEHGEAWWVGRKHLEMQRRNFNCEPERDDVYGDVSAAFKVQAMVEDK